MKHITFFQTLSYGALLSLICFTSWAQKTSFDVKQHKDTVLNKTELKAIPIDGSLIKKDNAQQKSYGNIKNSITAATASGLRKSNETETVYSKESGLPIFISTPTNTVSARLSSPDDVKQACYNYLNSISSVTRIANPKRDFDVKHVEKDEIGKTHVRLVQKYKGLKVYDSEISVHFNRSDIAETFNGNYYVITQAVDTIPQVSPEKAVATVISDISAKTTYRALSKEEKELLDYTGPVVDTVIYEVQQPVRNYVLAYHISIYPNLLENWDYFVDARTGTVIKSLKKSCHADGPRTATATDLNNVSRSINTYMEGSGYLLYDASRPMYNVSTQNGAIMTLDANNTFGNNFKVQMVSSSNNGWTNKTAVSAHYNAGRAYDYFRIAHGRNSIDGNGGSIISVINQVDEDGSALDNAYWNGKAMFYGNGNVGFKPLAGSMDVAGHEMTHGVVQNTANLKYEGESGAINESMADIFGCMMDSTNWLIGEHVVKTNVFTSGALRSLSDPHNGGNSLSDNGYQPRHMNEKYTGTGDHGGVHINSGIPNWAFYKFAIALNSKRNASRIFYRALTIYLTASSKFIDLRIAVIQAAKDLYGNSSNEATQAAIAFDAVGITDGTGGVYTSTLPTNPGVEYLLSYDTDGSHTDGLYRSSPTATNFKALLTKTVYNKPSVTDDGEGCVLVGTDKRLYAINADPSKPLNLTTLQNQAIWSSVAVSKDGNRIAAITYDKDTSIYVYDFDKAQWARFSLYNPTFTQGVKSAGPIYADAIEWSYDGESLVYDCFNRITNTNGSNIEYWDINIIKVWDKSQNNFADGEIVKLFNNLDVGESIGNPTFSKNSPYVLAFDYIDEDDDVYGIVGLDIEKNSLELIAVNNTIGWPSFNKNDTRVAFTTIDGGGNYDINYVTLNADKISSNKVQTKLIDNAQWPVYYTVGFRDITSDLVDDKIETRETTIYPNPVKDELSIRLSDNKTTSADIEVYNQIGQLVLKSTTHKTGDEVIKINVHSLTEGLYFLTIRDGNSVSTHKFIKY